jgi:hypothetical protein
VGPNGLAVFAGSRLVRKGEKQNGKLLDGPEVTTRVWVAVEPEYPIHNSSYIWDTEVRLFNNGFA